ncbi:uncharacterized protein LOC126376943 [Pectinophora gossypiella]|uniref:uncharacterized protein LOC126376943 n=1 Tax=Pectinophora gossypiella TaxID=13191 RepID=UPI00214EF94B|nr:uncharacterized protein LOC126376943 [Pectinophora gossypiella]
MGQDDDVATSIAHLVLCGVAGRGISRISGKSFTHPGMHANFLVHGIVGFLHYQSGVFNNDFSGAYALTSSAARYLALPCLMADLYHSNATLRVLHLISGLIPFVMDVTGNGNAHLGNVIIAINIISLCHYSMENNREWGWYTAGAGLFAYFAAPQTGLKVLYPLGLAIMEYCAYRVFHVQFDDLVDSRGRRRPPPKPKAKK